MNRPLPIATVTREKVRDYYQAARDAYRDVLYSAVSRALDDAPTETISGTSVRIRTPRPDGMPYGFANELVDAMKNRLKGMGYTVYVTTSGFLDISWERDG